MQKKLIYILLLISLFSLTFGCQTESYDFGREDSSIEVLEDGRLRVPILLHIPEREVVETKTTPNDAEKAVKTVDVCVFDAASGNRLEKVSGVIDPNNPLRVFATVSPRNVACQVQVYVNIPARCRVAFNAADNKAKIDTLTMSNVIFKNDSITKNGLPMVSAVDSYTALNSTTLKDKVATLKFAYARIDVGVSSAADFTLASFQGLNFRQNSYLIEQTPLALSDMYKSTETTQLSGIYLFESPGSNPTDLIIKGTKTGFGEGFYKIRIAYGTDKATYDIRRGVRYAVTITSVKGPGYASAKEAEENEPSNVEVDITVDDGSSKDVIISNGSYYLGVSNSEFIVCADNAYGVTATTLSHNAPASVSTATIQVQGEEITLSANQQGLTVLQDGKSATINLQTPKVPIKVNLASTAQPGTLTIRIGDLVKTIAIKKIAKVEDAGGTKSLSDLGLTNSSIVTMNSLSPRITVDQDKSLVVGQAVNSKYDAYSYAEAFSTGQQGTIRIAVKQTIQNVVYYEQYTDDSYGFYFRDNTSTLSEDKTIKDTGYGILGTRSDITKIQLGNHLTGQIFNPGIRVISGLSDCSLILYPMSHNDITPVVDTNAVGILINGDQTPISINFIYPNFAKLVTTSGAIATSTPFSIRTPKQFRNINAIASLDGNTRTYRQERDLNFADTNVGGAASFTSAIIANSFTGNYDGAGKRISNLTLNNTNENSPGENIAIFASLGPSTNKTCSVKNLVLNNLSVTGKVNRVACLVARNYGVIEGIHATKCKVVSSFTFYYKSMPGVGIIVGENFNTIKNCLVEFHDTGFTISSTTVRVGCIVGCNQENSYGVSDCCVVATINPFGGTIQQYTGGIVGFNESPAVRCIYLARGPLFNNSSRWPISGGNDGYYSNTTTNCYFLKGNNYNRGSLSGGGTGYTTVRYWVKPQFNPGYYVNGFKERTLEELGLVTGGYWKKETDCPYPKLISFSVPLENYPVANN